LTDNKTITNTAGENSQINEDLLLDSFKYILDFYYGDVELQTVRTILSCDDRVIDIEDIESSAKDFGLNFERTELSSDIMESHILPCIAMGANGALGVIVSFDEGVMELWNPSSKTKEKHGVEELGARFDTLIHLYKNIQYRNILTPEEHGTEWFWKHLWNSSKDLSRVALFTIFINVFVIFMPLYTMNVYNRVIPAFAEETLFVLTFGIILIFVFDAIFKMARAYILESMGRKIGSHLEEELLKRLLLVQSGHDGLLAGAKANLFKEIAQVRDFFMSKSIGYALDLPFALLTFVVIFIFSAPIALVAFVCGAVILALNVALHMPVAGLNKRLFKDGQLKHNFLFETIKGIETLKLTNASTRRQFKWRQLVSFYNFINLKIQMYTSLSVNTSYIIMQLATVLTLVVGVYQIHDKNLTVGALVALSMLVGRAMVPIVNISSILGKYKEFHEALVSLNKFWHIPLETQKPIEIGLKKLEGKIEFNNVSFTYTGSKHPSITSATFTIAPGEKVGFIGRTGAGKSTILRLLTGLDTPSSGTIFVDGHEINTVHPVELRHNIGIMPQEPFLFAGTLKENIEIGRSVGKDKLIKLLAMTGLEDLVKRSGEGENFQVGEGGSRLSVGQRHLVGLARALINEPQILILDEPTTGMDVSLEREMIDHLRPIVADKTLIVITHRFAALDLVDRVIVVNNGRLVADGPKDKILAQLSGNA